MENLKTVLGFIVAITIGWHIKVGLSSDTNISGFFQEKPELAYSWKETGTNVGGLGAMIALEAKSGYPYIESMDFSRSMEMAQRSLRSLPSINVNDFITKIEGQSTKGWKIEQVRGALTGQVGSSCSIVIWRNEGEIPVTFTRESSTALEDQEKLNSAYSPTSHFFWDNNDVVWCPGFVHPKFNVQSAASENTWKALPGYVLNGAKEGDLSTTWKQGLQHPYMKAFSSPEEGRWVASLGYKFVMQDGLATDTEWAAGTTYPELKVTASDKEGNFNSFPGYTFKNPNENLDVVWTPGLKDPNNPYKVSGDVEGSWVDVEPVYSSEPTWQDELATSAGTGLSASFIEWLFGKNFVSDELNKKSDEALARSAVKGFIELTK
jgi:hypothetical protein